MNLSDQTPKVVCLTAAQRAKKVAQIYEEKLNQLQDKIIEFVEDKLEKQAQFTPNNRLIINFGDIDQAMNYQFLELDLIRIISSHYFKLDFQVISPATGGEIVLTFNDFP